MSLGTNFADEPENDVRPSVVGRKRWLFIGHPDAGWRSAVIYTSIQSCRRRGINPQNIHDVLSRLPSMKNHEVKDSLPNTSKSWNLHHDWREHRSYAGAESIAARPYGIIFNAYIFNAYRQTHSPISGRVSHANCQRCLSRYSSSGISVHHGEWPQSFDPL